MYAQMAADGSTVTNIVVADEVVAKERGLTAVPDHVSVGWKVTGGTWTPAPSPVPQPDPTTTAQVDTAGLASAMIHANATPTLASLQAAVLALGASITPHHQRSGTTHAPPPSPRVAGLSCVPG
jgi:hypothetical protein